MAEEVSDIEKLAELSGTEKSAILMMLLGEEEAAQVLQNLTPKEVQHLGTAMYSVAGVDEPARRSQKRWGYSPPRRISTTPHPRGGRPCSLLPRR